MKRDSGSVMFHAEIAPLERSCTSKKGYTDREHAESDAGFLTRRFGRGETVWSVYTCPYCGLTHVGRPMQRRAYGGPVTAYRLDGGAAVEELGKRVVYQIVQENEGHAKARRYWIGKRLDAARRRALRK